MKKLINFGGTRLSVNYNKEVAESIKSSLNTLYVNLTHITLPKIPIQNIEDESKKWYKNYMSNLDTTLTGDQLIAKGDKILQDAKDLDDEMTRTVNILSCYEALQSGDTNLMRKTLQGLYNSKWYDIEWLKQKKELYEMTPEELKKELEEYFNENYKKNAFISGIIIEKLENESKSSKSYSSGSATKINASTIEPAIILNSNGESEKLETNNNSNTNSNNNKKVTITSQNKSTEDIDAQTPKTVTKTNTNVETPISTTSTKNNATEVADIIGGTTKATSIGTITSSASNLSSDESSSKDLSDSVIDKVNFESVSEGISGTLNSAIDTINKIKSNSPLKLTKIKSMDIQDNSGNSFIPPIAGISTATVAGIGTKMYIDKKDEDKDDTDSFFSKDEQKEIKEEKEKTKEENKTMSKEDLIKAIEYNRK